MAKTLGSALIAYGMVLIGVQLSIGERKWPEADLLVVVGNSMQQGRMKMECNWA